MALKRFAFSKSRRLTRRAEFERVKKSGEVHPGKSLLLNVLRVEHEAWFRAGFVTSRKIGGAVVRNRVRRRLREIVRKHQHEVVEAVWIVTVARAAAARATFAQLEDAWLRLARRASILAL